MSNWKLGKTQYGFLSTATSGGTLTLTASSKQIQIFTGTSSHTMKLPNATTTSNGSGISFTVINQSTGSIIVQDNGSNTIATVGSGSSLDMLLTSHATANGVWRTGNFSSGGGGGAGAVSPSLKTSNYTIVSGDKGGVINVDSSSGAISITLPVPIANFVVTVKDIFGQSAINNITVFRNGSETIDGANTDIISSSYNAVTYICDGTNWFRMSKFAGPSPLPGYPRGLFAGGFDGSSVRNTIDYITISTISNATNFGNLTANRQSQGGCASTTRGCFGGGSGPSNAIDYVTMTTIGNATTFGTLTVARDAITACSDSTRGVWAGGTTGSLSNVMDYVTIATTGIATSFGNLTVAREYPAGCSSPTRGVFGGGGSPGATSVIDYITIATTGNATSFGTLSVARTRISSSSNAIRGLFGGGNAGSISAVIDYITIATTGIATSFGNLTVARQYLASCSSTTLSVFGGGLVAGPTVTMDYVTIATTGNAANFGDLTVSRYVIAACSNAHGGL